MTFTPQVLTQIDTNNSGTTTGTTFTGISTNTTGFNTIILTIECGTYNSTAGGIEVEFSDDNVTFTTYYTDTYFSPNVFTKNYLIIKKYYRINYTSSSSATFNITSRLSTDLDSSITQNTSITVFDNNIENTIDAFGKLRVTNPTTLIDIRFPGQSDGSPIFLSNNLQLCNASSGSFTGTYSNSTLTITGSGNGCYISQSRNYCTYQPGKSLLFMASGILSPVNLNFTTRIGYFDNVQVTSPLVVKNGLYFQFSAGSCSVNISNNGTNTISVSESSWNIDKMNGYGPSGLTIDYTKAQLFVIDMEWLSVGRIRFGFYAYGKIQYCHQVTNVNSLTGPYTTSINLPICYSIHNTIIGETSTTFTQICSTVISEGGYTPVGRPFTLSTESQTGVTINGNIEEPILFLRGGGSNYYHQNIIPTELTMINANNNDLILYKLILFLATTYTGTEPIWTNVNSNYSVAQYSGNLASGYNSTNGIVLDQGYFYGKGTNTYSSLGNVFSTQVLQLTSNISNNSDYLVLTATFVNSNTSATTTVYGTLSWQEIY